MSSMEERVAARFASSQRESGRGYGPQFVKIVPIVDELESAAKKLPAAKAALEHLKSQIKRDPDVKDDENVVFGLEQQLGYVEKEIAVVEKAVTRLAEAYDDANTWFLEKGLK